MYQLWFINNREELILPSGESFSTRIFGLMHALFKSHAEIYGPSFLCELEKPDIPEISHLRTAAFHKSEIGQDNALQVFIPSTAEMPYKPELVELISDKTYRPFSDEHFWEGERLGKDNEEFYWLCEWISIEQAVSHWLIPTRNPKRPNKYLLPKDRFISSSTQVPGITDSLEAWRRATQDMAKADLDYLNELWQKSYLDGVFRYRTSSAGGELLVTEDDYGKKNLTYLYKSKSLFALAWIEIMWAIQNDIYAQFCDECGGIFQLTPPYERVAYTCSSKCAKQHRIKRMGGLEAMREYNRKAQIRSRGKRI